MTVESKRLCLRGMAFCCDKKKWTAKLNDTLRSISLLYRCLCLI